MSARQVMSIEDVGTRLDRILAFSDADLVAQAPAIADELLAMGEAVLQAWIASRDMEPTEGKVEGFRLLALHRQGARGDPSFNACRETCREIVYHRNLILDDPGAADLAQTVRLGAMVVRHLELFVSGKLLEAGLGEFCCSSRPLRRADDPTQVAAKA